MATTPSLHPPIQSTRRPVQKAALAVGVVFAAVGVLGFVPGATTNVADLAAAGHESDAMLLGLFQVSVLHNIVHLVFGIIGIAMSRRPEASLTYLLVGGIVYLVLCVYGLLVDRQSDANIVPLNAADDWLHLALGLGMIALGLLTTRRHARSSALPR
jgi:hypothetical protein